MRKEKLKWWQSVVIYFITAYPLLLILYFCSYILDNFGIGMGHPIRLIFILIFAVLFFYLPIKAETLIVNMWNRRLKKVD